MKTESGLPVSAPPSGQPLWRRIIRWPSTQLGWWSVGLAGACVILVIVWRTILMRRPGTAYQVFTMLCGLVAGIVSLIAVTRQHERSWLVWLAILPALYFIGCVLCVFLFLLAMRNAVW